MAEGRAIAGGRTADFAMVGYICALVFPPLGLLLGLVVLARFDGRRAGLQIVAISIIVMIAFALLFGLVGSSTSGDGGRIEIAPA